jgi:probable rRNA maturation factor
MTKTKILPLLRVEIVNAARAPLGARWLRSVLQAGAEVPGVRELLPQGGASLTVRISGDRELRRLNGRFLGEDAVTDVLSFPAGDAGSYLGDLVLSWPAAMRQAKQYGHAPEVEVALLTIHGLLHLLGLDHAEVEGARRMHALTRQALAASGLAAAAGRF